jgi:predicted amidophosphoribosyltransferase
MRRQAGDLLEGVDWVIPVPLHWRRRGERGFNQAADLARALILRPPRFALPRFARSRFVQAQPQRGTQGGGDGEDAVDAIDGRPRLLHALRRVRHTTVQADLPAARRHKNVRDAFELSGSSHMPRLRRGEDAALRALDGSCALIVDDVSTTGATMEACARVLKAAGVKEIRAITAARVVMRPSR